MTARRFGATAWLALAWLLCIAAGALGAPLLAPAGPFAADAARSLLPPGGEHPLGTDWLGRDVWARLLWGGRWTLGMGLVGLATAVGLGLPVGTAAGALGGWADAVLMRIVDALLAVPGLLLAMTAVALWGRGAFAAAAAVGLAAAPAYARVARAAILEVRAQPYIEAARAIGCNERRIVIRHMLPNAAPSLVAFGAAQFGWALLNAAALNFLGLGVPPGVPEWGAMLAEGRGYLRDAPWVSLCPGLALTATVLAVNLISD